MSQVDEIRRYVKFKVEVDIHRPIVPGWTLDRGELTPIWISFKYERLPNICFNCGRFDHDTKSCSSDLTTGNARFGPWMRADHNAVERITASVRSMSSEFGSRQPSPENSHAGSPLKMKGFSSLTKKAASLINDDYNLIVTVPREEHDQSKGFPDETVPDIIQVPTDTTIGNSKSNNMGPIFMEDSCNTPPDFMVRTMDKDYLPTVFNASGARPRKEKFNNKDVRSKVTVVNKPEFQMLGLGQVKRARDPTERVQLQYKRGKVTEHNFSNKDNSKGEVKASSENDTDSNFLTNAVGENSTAKVAEQPRWGL